MTTAERAALQEWAALHRCCGVCWWPESDMRRRLEVHHISGGNGRKHDRRNYLRLCERCHGIFHSGKIYGGQPDLDKRTLLGVKEECDPDNYDPAYLATLRNKKHLGYEPAPLPDYYINERQRNITTWTIRQP